MDPIAAAIAEHEARLHGVTPPPDPDPEPGGPDPWGLTLMAPPNGLEREFYTNFREDGDRELGQGIGPHLQYFKPRRNMPDSSQRGTYNDITTWSQHDGIGDVFLHSGTATALQHDPQGKVHHVFALVDEIDRPEVFVQWTQKCPTTASRKQAPLFWAFGKNDNGEDDHYEHKYGAGPRSNSFHHHYLKQTQNGKALNVVTTDPHVVGMYFRRKGHRGTGDLGEFTTWVDSKKIITWTNDCTPNPMHFVMQIETFLKSDPIVGWDSIANRYNGQAAAGHVQFTQLEIAA
jgi:hypothetical protein